MFVRLTLCGDYSLLDVPFINFDIPWVPTIDTEMVLSAKDRTEIIALFSQDEYYFLAYDYQIANQIIATDKLSDGKIDPHAAASKTVDLIKKFSKSKNLEEIERMKIRYPFKEEYLSEFIYVNRIVYYSEKRIFVLGLCSEPFYG